jgi:NMD protein affecting ribosome stability and mRNA decay
MPVCKSCGTSVGCGCQLVNGLCTKCNSALIESQNKPEENKTEK